MTYDDACAIDILAAVREAVVHYLGHPYIHNAQEITRHWPMPLLASPYPEAGELMDADRQVYRERGEA